ncbi:MAG: HlyD family secretion protein [Gemmataceae bacterium]|nr:HlyD family secretion protein [Gemmataceae bacterium]MCS7270661.1 HlyD family secretion protein [Gemmataceae bacterium]MDW8242951.1 HlyD family efflux transporter periplasmic adaptor subunit [Thermogemmata sp.]
MLLRSRLRPAMLVLGVLLLALSLFGAKALTHGPHDSSAAQRFSTGTVRPTGLIVLGTVDTDPPPVAYGLPPVLQSGTIAEVYVKEQQSVRAGDRLYSFDTSLLQRDLDIARAELEVANTRLDEAKAAAEQHAKSVAIMEKVVAGAEDKVRIQSRLYNLIRDNLENFWRNQAQPKLSEEEIRKKLQDDDKLFEANSKYLIALNELGVEQARLAQLRSVDPQVKVRQALAAVKRVEAELAKAQTAIDLCTIRARSAGTVERITISPGTTMGISTREPALWLIPDGKRIIRAEVEADFAHRVTPELIGKPVTIYDNTDPRLTYTGVLRRISGTFLPKRSTGESLLNHNDTRVLEAVIEVDDPAPVGKPPLRVGQRVRVSLGQ